MWGARFWGRFWGLRYWGKTGSDTPAGVSAFYRYDVPGTSFAYQVAEQ